MKGDERMSMRFLLGRSGTGKTAYIMDEMYQKLLENAEGDPIIYLVPDQMTFLSEYKLMRTTTLSGMIRTQVLSFSRLAWRVLQETGGMSRTHLDSVGVSMLIRKIIEEKKDELKVFKRSADKQGFIAQLEALITEFKHYCISPDELSQFVMNEGTESAVRDKLHDLDLIYQSFAQELMGKYLQSEDYFTLLIKQMADSAYIKNAEIYIDGFYSLTPQELLVVQELMKHCKSITVALTLDRSYKNYEPSSLELFRQTGTLYYQLYQAALRIGMLIEEDIILNEGKRYVANSGLGHLEKNFSVRPISVFEGEASLILAQATNRRTEVEGVARTIVSLVRNKQYRYQEIAILVRNGIDYQDVIQTVFGDYQIPYYLDDKRAMHHHPLIEFIRSTFEILLTNWRYEPVFQAIKTELLFPLDKNPDFCREQVDRLENYVLSRGIKGDQWTSQERWVYRRFRGLELEERRQTDAERTIEDELNEWKEWYTEPIKKLSKRMKRAKTVKQLAEALYLYLEEVQVPEKLDKLRMEAEASGRLEDAREHEQCWNAVVDLLDQFVELMSEEEMTVKTFATIMDAGLDSLNFSLVPQSLDQVIIANLDLSRLDEMKALFIIGLNDGVFPRKASSEGIFTDHERDALLERGFVLAASSKQKLLDEEFIAYKAFTAPSHALYLSYPLADEEGKALLPSPYVKRMRELFSSIQETIYTSDPTDLTAEEQVKYVVNHDVALSYLTTQLQLMKRNYPIHDIWLDVYNSLIENDMIGIEVARVLSSLFYENKTVKLSEPTTKELYGEQIISSVSRVEMFNSCPFAHYASYGLKLRERLIYRLDAPDIGELFHGALKFISDYIGKENLSWASLTKEQCYTLARIAIEALAPKLQNQILLSSNRHHYLKRKLEQVIGKTSIALSQQAKLSGFVPVGLELDFGRKGKLPPLTFTLKNGTKMELVGRIDRVDKAESESGTFLRVLDYKSSTKELDMSEVYFGLALQMLTYLDIVITHSNQLVGNTAQPAGVLYFHVHNPLIRADKMLSPEELEDRIFKDFKMKGLVLGDKEVIQMMDQSLEDTDSNIIPAGFKKDGTLKKASKIASPNEFSLLQQHVRQIHQEAGDKMVSGDIGITPYKLKDKKPCTFCSYKSICQFDQSLEENDYRNLQAKKSEDILNLLTDKKV